MKVQFNLAGQNMIMTLAERKKISCSRENKGKSIEGEGEGHSLMTDVESNLGSWKRKRQVQLWSQCTTNSGRGVE